MLFGSSTLRMQRRCLLRRKNNRIAYKTSNRVGSIALSTRFFLLLKTLFLGESVFLQTVDGTFCYQFVSFVPVFCDGLCHLLCNLFHFHVSFLFLIQLTACQWCILKINIYCYPLSWKCKGTTFHWIMQAKSSRNAVSPLL